MAFPKHKPPSPPKDKIVKEKRLVNGKLTPVEIFNGKIVRVFDNEGNVIDDRSAKFGNKLPPLPEAKTKSKVENGQNRDLKETTSSIISTSDTGRLQIVSKEDVATQNNIISKEDSIIKECPQCKGTNFEPILHLENATRYKCKDCDETFIGQKQDVQKIEEDLLQPQEQMLPTEYEKMKKMSDEEFKREIADINDGAFEGMMKRSDLNSWERSDIRGRRVLLRSSEYKQESPKEIPKEAPKEIPKTEDKKPEGVPKVGVSKAEVPDISNAISSTSLSVSTSGVGNGIPLIPKEETVGQGSGPGVVKVEVVTPKPEKIVNTAVTIKDGDTATYVPKIEPVIPRIEVPKSEPPKYVKDIPAPGVSIPVMDRLSKIMEEKVKDDKIKEDKTKDKNIKQDKEKSFNVTRPESPKEETPKEVSKAEIPKEILEETPKIEQSEKKPKEVKHFMAEEDEEIMQERKFEQWLKKNRFQESVEKTAKISEENQEKIEGISNEIANVKEGLGGVENRIDTLKDGLNSVIGETKKPITETLGELCEGVDCIKKDVAKYQDTQSELDKKLDSRFSELRERVQKLEEPTFTCDNCGTDGIRLLSSFCPNCGSPIHSWNDENGQPIKGWVPYWKRVVSS